MGIISHIPAMQRKAIEEDFDWSWEEPELIMRDSLDSVYIIPVYWVSAVQLFGNQSGGQDSSISSGRDVESSYPLLVFSCARLGINQSLMN